MVATNKQTEEIIMRAIIICIIKKSGMVYPEVDGY